MSGVRFLDKNSYCTTACTGFLESLVAFYVWLTESGASEKETETKETRPRAMIEVVTDRTVPSAHKSTKLGFSTQTNTQGHFVLWTAHTKCKNRSAAEVRKAPPCGPQESGTTCCASTAMKRGPPGSRHENFLKSTRLRPGDPSNLRRRSYSPNKNLFVQARPTSSRSPLSHAHYPRKRTRRYGGKGGALCVKTAATHRFGRSPADQRSIERKTKTPQSAVLYRRCRCGLPYLPQAAQHDTRDARP